MLVLTRNIGERIYINDDIIIKVTGVKGCQVRLAIEAPKDVPIHREEIQNIIKGRQGRQEPRS